MTINGIAWQESWDRQQEAYMPDREHRFTAMLDVVESINDGRPPVILDLAGGTGSISLRALRRFPHAHATLLDLDPAVSAIARASLDPERSTIVAANLLSPQWSESLPRHDYDAVLTATALHWIAPDRLTALYAEIRDVLRPGGVFINADHMPDDGLPELSSRVAAWEQARREARWAAGAVLSWAAWWEHAAKDAQLGPLVREREKIFAVRHSAESYPPASWHLQTLRSAGFAEVGLVWRGGQDAAVAAVRQDGADRT
ncbi:class I SAM-dependent methyltransferase [Allorhizocola rhizosphaerae]|uniref:class I SAM-dependent methyltransferase n=1 Tax=Allorhizocola rhizosphaerae TaxID=1872709 RepID=UPI000E3DA341|nr:class I SAM-dependent methyltransferase [Allorhizocola rhizosphaerae]